MRENGSPPPEFETDEERSYFLTRLPVHPLSTTTIEKKMRGVTPKIPPHVTPSSLEIVIGR
jgi:ATP-dependent DNA helicase RecG